MSIKTGQLRSAAIGASALIAVSCTTVDQEILDAQLPSEPTAWAADADVSDAPTGDWIAAFDDAALRELILEALRNNNDLRAAASNLTAARSRARVSRADLLPSVGANLDASRNAIVTDPRSQAEIGDINDPTAAASLEDRDKRLWINNFSLGGQLRWEIDVWGRVLDETRASYKDAKAAYADLAGVELSIAARTAQAWFSLIEAREQRELAERDVAARESNLRVTDRRYERGVASSLDVRLSRSALGTSQANLALRQRLEKEAARALEILLGRYPSAELQGTQSLPALPALQGAGAPGDILARRPDLVAAEARMEAVGLRARAARKQLLPQFTLTTSAQTSGPDFADLIDAKRLAGNLIGGIFQPIFQGGRLLYNSDQARAQAEASVYNYVQTVLSAYGEAEDAIAAETLLAAREDALRLAFEEAAAAEELTERRYSSGAATIFNLLDAQTRRISAESQYIQAKQQRVSNRVQLYLAIGGDFLPADRIALLIAEFSED